MIEQLKNNVATLLGDKMKISLLPTLISEGTPYLDDCIQRSLKRIRELIAEEK